MTKKNFTRKNLIRKIYQDVGFSKNFSSKIIDNFFESLISALVISNKIKISSFGTFKVINTKERTGRNPKTKIEARILPLFEVKLKQEFYIEKS